MTTEPHAPLDTNPAVEAFPAVPTEYVRAGATWFSRNVHILVEELYPLLKSLPKQTVDEFPDMDEDDDEVAQSVTFRQFARKHEAVISSETTLSFNVWQLLALMYELAESLGGQAEADLIRMMSDAATTSGNIVTANLEDPTEAFIESLEAMSVEFDEDGDHSLQIVAGAEFMRRLQEYPPTEEQSQRIDEILKAKREEQDATHRRRRLS